MQETALSGAVSLILKKQHWKAGNRRLQFFYIIVGG